MFYTTVTCTLYNSHNQENVCKSRVLWSRRDIKNRTTYYCHTTTISATAGLVGSNPNSRYLLPVGQMSMRVSELVSEWDYWLCEKNDWVMIGISEWVRRISEWVRRISEWVSENNDWVSENNDWVCEKNKWVRLLIEWEEWLSDDRNE